MSRAAHRAPCSDREQPRWCAYSTTMRESAPGKAVRANSEQVVPIEDDEESGMSVSPLPRSSSREAAVEQV